MAPPSKRTRLILILVPVLGGYAAAIALTAAGASEGVAVTVGIAPLVVPLGLLVWLAVGTTDDMQLFAELHEWEYVGSSGTVDVPRGYPFSSRDQPAADYLARGEHEGRSCSAFEFTARRRVVGRTLYPRFACVAVRLDQPVPFVSVGRKSWAVTASDARVGAPVRFPGSFGDDFVVWSDDAGFARALLTPDVCAVIAAEPDVLWRCDRFVALSFRNDTITAVLAVELLDHLERVLEVAPDVFWAPGGPR